MKAFGTELKIDTSEIKQLYGVVKWRDNKIFTLASTAYSQDPVGVVERWKKEQKCWIEVICSNIVMEYNKNMRRIDTCDQLIECYRTWLKFKKLILKVEVHFLDLSVVNAWMEYRLDCRSKNMQKHYYVHPNGNSMS